MKRFVLIFILAIALNINASAQTKSKISLVTKETSLGKVPPVIQAGAQLVSPDSSRVAFIVRHKDKFLVIENGKPGKEYDSIMRRSLSFSPDSKRFVYAARRGTDWFLVLDGVEQKIGAELVPNPLNANPLFSFDSKRVAMVLKRGDKVSVVIDGAESALFDSITGVTFSRDSRRWAYSATRGGKSLIVTNDGEGTEYKSISLPLFSPDSQRLAYIAYRGDEEFAVVSGVEGKSYSMIDGLTFSPDSKRLAYQAVNSDKKIFAVVDGVEGKAYNAGRSSPVYFSPDSQHVAYVATNGEKPFVVFDGIEQKEYPFILELVFSPDSRHLAYRVKIDEKQDMMVMDSREGKTYPSIEPESVRFSPDSQHLAYRVSVLKEDSVKKPSGDQGGSVDQTTVEEFIVLDGAEGPKWPSVSYPVFSPDSKYLAYAVTQNNKWLVVINGPQSKKYDVFLNPKRMVFDSNGAAVVAERKGKVLKVEVRIKS